MPIALALYQPDIAQNTGAVIRLGACLDVPVHIIHPTGFPFSRAALKRSGLDYLEQCTLIEHATFEAFSDWCTEYTRPIALLSTKGTHSVYEHAFAPETVLLMGRESAGVPERVAERAQSVVRLPMQPHTRSLNVALASAMAMAEAKRQTGQFEGLS